LKDFDTENYICLPELSVSDVTFFIKAVYSGKLPSCDMGLQAVMVVNEAISKISTGFKSEKTDSIPDEAGKENKAEQSQLLTSSSKSSLKSLANKTC